MEYLRPNQCAKRVTTADHYVVNHRTAYRILSVGTRTGPRGHRILRHQANRPTDGRPHGHTLRWLHHSQRGLDLVNGACLLLSPWDGVMHEGGGGVAIAGPSDWLKDCGRHKGGGLYARQPLHPGGLWHRQMHRYFIALKKPLPAQLRSISSQLKDVHRGARRGLPSECGTSSACGWSLFSTHQVCPARTHAWVHDTLCPGALVGWFSDSSLGLSQAPTRHGPHGAAHGIDAATRWHCGKEGGGKGINAMKPKKMPEKPVVACFRVFPQSSHYPLMLCVVRQHKSGAFCAPNPFTPLGHCLQELGHREDR